MAYDTLTVTDPAEHVIVVTLDRPEAANAFNTRMAEELVEVFERYQTDLQETRAVVLTGRGDKAFCAGGDLKQRDGMSDEDWGRQHLVFERMTRAILDCPVPLIGAVNGAAYGGGCELVALCDFAYAAEGAKFAQTEVRIGIIPGAGGTQTLARAVGAARAKELILSARPFSAAEALEWGLVNAVYPQAGLLDAAFEAARAIAANAPVAVRQAKQAIGRGMSMALRDGLAFEIECYNRTVPTEDRREGVRAFNEKRPPAFKGR